MKKKKGQRMTSDPETWSFPLSIAYAVDWRDPDGHGDDTELTFVFTGATGSLIYAVFELLCVGGYIMRGFRMQYEHLATLVYRNGHHYWQWAVTPVDYHPDFLSLPSLRYLIESRIRDKGHEVTYFDTYNIFLNKT